MKNITGILLLFTAAFLITITLKHCVFEKTLAKTDRQAKNDLPETKTEDQIFHHNSDFNQAIDNSFNGFKKRRYNDQ